MYIYMYLYIYIYIYVYMYIYIYVYSESHKRPKCVYIKGKLKTYFFYHPSVSKDINFEST